ncbi:MAG: DUF4012 domain-containing protein [Patescibacteria group bacterium]|jgi:hypothetical protein
MNVKKHFIFVGQLILRALKYLAIISFGGIILLIILLSSAYGDFKKAVSAGLAAKAALTSAVTAIKVQDWSAALKADTEAQLKFSEALNALNDSRQHSTIRNVGLIVSQINDLEYLLQTGEILSRSLKRVLPIVQKLDDIRSGTASRNFIDLSLNDKSSFLQLIYESEPELSGLKANLDLATLNLDRIHQIGVLWPIFSQISNIKQELRQASVIMSKISPVIKLLPALAGYPNNSRYLLILQNNDELRATGGFIGVYGILDVKNGTIISLKTDDSYHLDMPASQSINWSLEPPAPLKKYLKVEKWYLRDANWSPDWPQSAKKIIEIYNGESIAIGQPSDLFTGIIAITPDLVADLIKLVGPITVNGATYNSDNFQALLQYNVEVAYKDQAISSWDRKNIINELVAKLKTRLFNLPSADWTKLFSILDNSVTKKNIQMYFFNPGWEDLVRTLGASGEVVNTDQDFLMVVDSNLAAFKSDVVVKKNLSYSLAVNNQSAQATVKLNYRHEGEFDWRTTRYRSYTRIYAPLDSQLVALNGVDQTTADISVTEDPILNKTVFGFFFTVEPGSSREITLSYRLPQAINEELKAKNYQLFVERQAGQRIESLTVSLNPGRGQNKKWSTDLNSNRIFQLY